MKKISFALFGLFLASSASADWSCASVCQLHGPYKSYQKVVTSTGINMVDAYEKLYNECENYYRYYASSISSWGLNPSAPTLACMSN